MVRARAGIGLAGAFESFAFDGHVGVEVNACRCLCFVAFSGVWGVRHGL